MGAHRHTVQLFIIAKTHYQHAWAERRAFAYFNSSVCRSVMCVCSRSLACPPLFAVVVVCLCSPWQRWCACGARSLSLHAACSVGGGCWQWLAAVLAVVVVCPCSPWQRRGVCSARSLSLHAACSVGGGCCQWLAVVLAVVLYGALMTVGV